MANIFADEEHEVFTDIVQHTQEGRERMARALGAEVAEALKGGADPTV